MNAVLERESNTGALRRGQVVEMSETVQTQVARLESDVQHILTNVADIKVELRRNNDRIDDVKKTLNERIDTVSETLNKRIDDLRDSLTSKIDALGKELASAKMWAIGLYVGQSATLLFVMAKGFKWL